MSDWPMLRGGNTFERDLRNLGGSRSTTFSAAASAHTKSAWSERVAALNLEASGFFLQIRCNSTGNRFGMDVGVGPAGSEQIILPDLLAETTSGKITFGYFPIRLPRGSRIACRAQSETASAIVEPAFTFIGSVPTLPVGLSRGATFGFDAATTKGLLVDPGGTANTKGAWTDIAGGASPSGVTPRPLRALYLTAIRDEAVTTGSLMLVDIGVWNGASYDVIVADIQMRSGPSDYIQPMAFIGPHFCDLPAGSRLGLRSQCASIVLADRVISATLIGLEA